MKDKEYYSRMVSLYGEVEFREDEILELALSLDKVISDPEKLRKIDENLFKLWEAVVHRNAAFNALKQMEKDRHDEGH